MLLLKLKLKSKHFLLSLLRYDIFDGEMKILNRFENASETVFAQSGEFFGQIYLSDYLVMDEAAGNLISRSVMSVILRLKLGQTQSNRIYECGIKMKTSQLVIIKLNEELCQEYVFEKDQSIYIDLKFRYNRIPICEMHQTIDTNRQKTEILLPNVENASYEPKVSNIVAAYIFLVSVYISYIFDVIRHRSYRDNPGAQIIHPFRFV